MAIFCFPFFASERFETRSPTPFPQVNTDIASIDSLIFIITPSVDKMATISDAQDDITKIDPINDPSEART